MFDITPIVEAVLMLLAVVITTLIIPYIRNKTTAEQQKELTAWVRIAVAAAEQIYHGVGRGAEKKRYVLEWLDAHDITIDIDKIDAIIEAAVYDLNNNDFYMVEPAENS